MTISVTIDEERNDFAFRLAADPAIGWSPRLRLPEHRQIELYTRRRQLSFLEPEPASDLPMDRVAALARTGLVLDALLVARHGIDPRLSSWERCVALSRRTQDDKIMAEIFRICRIARTVAFHPAGHVEMRDAIVRMNGAIDRVALSLEITVAGIDLVESAVAWWIAARQGPWPRAWIEAMLESWFFDIVAEIRRFADEDRILCQFRRRHAFNRHFRFDCDNPRIVAHDETIEFEIGEPYRDPARFPIDFFVVIDDRLHIVPVEVLKDGHVARRDLPKWRAHTADGLSLPASFRPRFAREVMVVGQPMT